MTPIYLTSIEIANLGPFANRKFKSELGMVSIILGSNAAGKTTVHDCIAMPFESGADRSLLSHGCNEGYSRVTFSNGYTAHSVLSINEKKGGVDYDLKIYNPDGGESRKPATIIKQWLPRGSFDPHTFLALKPQEMADYLLKYVNISFTGVEINGALDARVGTLELEPVTHQKSDLIVNLAKFNEIRGEIFSARTEVNGQIRDLEGTVNDLREAMVADDGVDWSARREELRRDIHAIDTSVATAEANTKLEAEQRRTKENNAARVIVDEQTRSISGYQACTMDLADLVKRYSHGDAHEKILIDELVDRVYELRDPFLKACRQLAERKQEQQETLATIDEWERDTIAQSKKLRAGERAEKSEALGAATQKAEQQSQTLGVRKAVEDRERKIQGRNLRAQQFTEILAALDRLKNERLRQLDIEGFDLKYDADQRPIIHIGETPIYRLNKQTQLFLAIKFIRKAQKANQNDEQLPMILFESVEIDDINLRDLEAACLEAEMQLIVTRLETDPKRLAAGGPLRVETVNG